MAATRLSSHWCLLVLWALLSSCLVHDVLAQTVVNGQIYTSGLAILDAPQMGSTVQVGGTLNIAVDVTGNGKLSVNSSAEGSTDSTRITFLEAYLISELTATNLTVIQGPGLLRGESGSSVKHFGLNVPACASPGAYNLTIYETSIVNGTGFFAITPIPMRITTFRPGGTPCSTLFNIILPLPQVSSPPPVQPWLGVSEHVDPGSSSQTDDTSTSDTSTPDPSSTPAGSSSSPEASSASDSTSTSASDASVSQTDSSSVSFTSTIVLPDPSSTAISTGSSSEGFITITKTEDGVTTTRTVTSKPSTITRVVSSVRTEVETRTESGTTELLTTTEEIVSTTTEVSGGEPSSVPGFFPVVNAAGVSSLSVPALASIPVIMYLTMML